MKVRTVKSVLWFFVGIAAVVGVARFAKGLGVSTALTDTTPWGFWIGFDILGGVALAAGGFVIAATVYIFHIERYRPILRPAVLTAFLGYAAVVGGLMFDIGLPWNIWRPMVHWQHHSALFEVAWCVMLYLTVLALEFSPVVLEKSPFHRLYKIMKALTIPLVIFGIMLSTLHQSSLGTLFLIMPFRLHELWYTPLLPLLFFVSAIGLGLGMVCVESIVSHWLFDKEAELELVEGLAKAAIWVLSLYLIIRIGDIIYHGKLGFIFDGSWESYLFLSEIFISAVLPIALFSIARARKSRTGLLIGASSIVFGFVFNRLNVGGIATITNVDSRYIPSWMEVSISVGVVSAAALAFLFFVEYFKVWEVEARKPEAIDDLPEPDPITGARLGFPWAPAWRQYSMSFIIAASLTFAFLPRSVIEGAQPEPIPVGAPKTHYAVKTPVEGKAISSLALIDRASDELPPGGEARSVLVLDGDRNGRMVLFDHESHQRNHGGEQSCAICHHMNKPLDRATSCFECHTDMYSPTDTFNHDYHVNKMGGNSACIECHTDPAVEKNRNTVTKCLDCHRTMAVAGSVVVLDDDSRVLDMAPGYMDAMHGLCVSCHEAAEDLDTKLGKDFSRCASCHTGSSEGQLSELGLYPSPTR